jgi:hypothetical protein
MQVLSQRLAPVHLVANFQHSKNVLKLIYPMMPYCAFKIEIQPHYHTIPYCIFQITCLILVYKATCFCPCLNSHGQRHYGESEVELIIRNVDRDNSNIRRHTVNRKSREYELNWIAELYRFGGQTSQ